MAIADSLKNILGELPGIILTLARDKLLDAAREYCEQGNAWMLKDEPIAIVAGTTDYVFTLPADSEFVRVLYQDQDNYISISCNEITKTGLKLKAAPSQSGTIKLSLVIKPTAITAVMDVPDDKAIEYGALFHCKRMSKVEWHDPEMAMFYRREFTDEINKAKQQSWNGNQGGTVRATPRQFI